MSARGRDARASEDGRLDDHLRQRLIMEHLTLAENLAWRFAGRGESHDDLVQVARVGLVNAANRFDPQRAGGFIAFAVPTIMGEIRRHFRDTAWALRVPRRLQELSLAVSSATASLSQELGRAPTARELAARLEVSVDEVVEALSVESAHRALSIDAPRRRSDSTEDGTLLDSLGDVDSSMEGADDRVLLNSLLADLPPREQEIIKLRFVENLTQSRIADRMGISQMHVSRILGATIAELRERMPRR
jgi:RNA polymerase sigma-B factor